MCFLPIFKPQLRAPLVPGPPPTIEEPSITTPTTQNTFKFSARSLSKFAGVHPDLKAVADRAIELTVQDFGVTEGLRTAERQRLLVSQGRSQTMNSRHITGHAIDVLAYSGKQHTWDIPAYLLIANAFVWAADEVDVAIRWGGAWHIPDIRVCRVKDDPGETMMELYRQTRKRQGRKTFVDAVHFEIPR